MVRVIDVGRWLVINMCRGLGLQGDGREGLGLQQFPGLGLSKFFLGVVKLTKAVFEDLKLSKQ